MPSFRTATSTRRLPGQLGSPHPAAPIVKNVVGWKIGSDGLNVAPVTAS